MTTWHIHRLINYSTGEVKPYEPGDLVHEILNAQARAAEAARLALVRERLAGLEPVTTPRRESGDSLVIGLFAMREE